MFENHSRLPERPEYQNSQPSESSKSCKNEGPDTGTCRVEQVVGSSPPRTHLRKESGLSYLSS